MTVTWMASGGREWRRRSRGSRFQATRVDSFGEEFVGDEAELVGFPVGLVAACNGGLQR
jgi:hypothetical protein